MSISFAITPSLLTFSSGNLSVLCIIWFVWHESRFDFDEYYQNSESLFGMEMQNNRRK